MDDTFTTETAGRLAERDRRAATWVRWTIVAGYLAGAALISRGGVTDVEMLGATVAGVLMVVAFLSAGWIAGGSWRD